MSDDLFEGMDAVDHLVPEYGPHLVRLRSQQGSGMIAPILQFVSQIEGEPASMTEFYDYAEDCHVYRVHTPRFQMERRIAGMVFAMYSAPMETFMGDEFDSMATRWLDERVVRPAVKAALAWDKKQDGFRMAQEAMVLNLARVLLKELERAGPGGVRRALEKLVDSKGSIPT